MANYIIQSYFDDPTISAEKKQYLGGLLDSAQKQNKLADMENKVADMIKSKYGDKPTNLGKIIKNQYAFDTVDISYKPDYIDQRTWDALKTDDAKRTMAVNMGKLMETNPEKAAQLQKEFSGRWEESDKREKEALQSKATDSAADSPSLDILGKAWGGLKKTVGGLYDLTTGVAESTYDMAKAGVQGLTGDEQGRKETLQNVDEQSKKAMSGLMNTITGPFETLLSPVTSAVERYGGETGQKIINAPNKGIELGVKALASNAAKLFGKNIDTETPEFQETVVRPIQTALQLYMVKSPGKVKSAVTKPVSAISEGVGKLVGKEATTAESLAGQIAQPKFIAEKSALKSGLESLDTTNVKTYSDLATTTTNAIKEFSRKMDETLNTKEPIPYMSKSLEKIIEVGNKKTTVNYINKALDQLKELYQKTDNIENAMKIENTIEKAKQTGLTLKEVNDIAREYGSQFKTKAFNKKGEPLTSVNAEMYENTRTGVKKTVRDLMPDENLRVLDKKISNLYKVKNYAEQMTEKVNIAKQKMIQKGVGQAITEKALGVVDMISGGALKGIKNFFTNIKKTSFNPVELEANLPKLLNKFDKLTSAIEKAKTSPQAVKVVYQWIKQNLTKDELIQAVMSESLIQGAKGVTENQMIANNPNQSNISELPPETYQEPKPEMFANEESYKIAIDRYARNGNWGTP